MTATSMDLSKWINDAEVCAWLGISDRTLYREVKSGALHPQFRPRPGIKPERVFDPEEVRGRLPAPPMRVMPPVSPHAAGSATLPATIPPDAALADTDVIIARLLDMVAESQRPPKPWATLEEASAELGLSRAFLRRLVKSGALDAVRDRHVKVRREDLEDLDVSAELLKPGKKGKR